MWLDDEKAFQKRDIVLKLPFVNASGTLGFAPDHRASPVLSHLGAFITNPISRTPRLPAENRACIPFPGGVLLHTGHANPGITKAVARYRRRWAAAELPIIVHLLAESPGTLADMVHKLEALENIHAVELGLPPDCDPALLAALMEAGLGELPLIPCVSPEQVPVLIGALIELQPVAMHLTEPRGALPGPDGNIVTGRLYGPAIFPVMLRTAQVLTQSGLRVIANGGLTARWQIDALMVEGVIAVGLGSVLWQVNQEMIF
jgi:dihydroorotate dehydrogenase (NAD+) catalytic subunit